jgi:hypothetical protein
MLDAVSISDEGSASMIFEVVVRGAVSEELIADLGAQRFELGRGKSLIVLEVIDQSHLHGLLACLQDRNIDIERVNPV